MNIKEFVITSKSNPLVTETIKLQKKRERDSVGRFLVDGRKLSYEYIRKCGVPYGVFVSSERSKVILAELQALELECAITLDVTLVADFVLEKMTSQSSPDGIILIGEKSALPSAESVRRERAERIIILDSLQDPGNVGTVLRTALALGYDRVILSEDCADVLSPKTLRASMGAAFSLPVSVVSSLSAFICLCKEDGRRIFAAELRESAVSLDEIDLIDTDVIVIGNEGHGVALGVSSACDGSVFIPISEQSESLNAAVAATVFMWQQRGSFR